MGFSVSQPASQPGACGRQIWLGQWKWGGCPARAWPPQARARKGQSHGTYWGGFARARASADQNFAKFGHPSAILQQKWVGGLYYSSRGSVSRTWFGISSGPVQEGFRTKLVRERSVRKTLCAQCMPINILCKFSSRYLHRSAPLNCTVHSCTVHSDPSIVHVLYPILLRYR